MPRFVLSAALIIAFSVKPAFPQEAPKKAPLPPLPAPQAIPKPAADTGQPYAPQAILPGEGNAKRGQSVLRLIDVELDGPNGLLAAAIDTPGAGLVGLGVLSQRLGLDPAEALVGRVFGRGVHKR